MTNKIEVIKLHQAHPHWPAKRLAQVLNCCEGYINACRYRYGLEIPYVQPRQNTRYELGNAAHEVGLTLNDIYAFKQGRVKC